MLIPREIDLRDVPEETRRQLEIVPVDNMDQVTPRVLLQEAAGAHHSASSAE